MASEESMRVLVTGGLGYIGRVMVQTLSKEGNEPVILDKMLYERPMADPSDQIDTIVADVNDEQTLRKSFKDIDAVVHLAAIVGDQACDIDKERAITTNYLATRKVARLCAEYKTRLVFFSTCSVYGAKPGSPITEKDDVLPLSIYAITKLAAEEAVASSGADYAILRLGTAYGLSPRMRFDLVVNRMIAQATKNNTISVFGGEQSRPFIHVRDIVANTLKILESGAQGLFNLGGVNWRIIDLGEKIRSSTGCEVNVFKEIRDPRNYSVDSTQAMQTWGAHFSYDIDTAVKEIQGYISNGNAKPYDDPVYNNADWLRKAQQ